VRPSSLNARRRAADLEALAAGETVDLLVVGGGVTGTGIALDAATRGLTVALVERRDLANGTSRWSSKLIHGGIRYLPKGQLRLAHESAMERGILLERTAPHLTRSLGMVAPIGVGFSRAQAFTTWSGFAVGNLLRISAGTARATLPPPSWITAQETKLLFPAVAGDGLTGGLLTWDGQLTDDARLVTAIARTAAAFGARIVTYAEAEEVTADGAQVRDDVDGDRFTVRARHVVNATGVWADRLHPEVRLAPSKGAHLVVPATRLGHPRAAITVPVPGEAFRYVFAVPQLDGRVIVGLTDDPVDAVSDDPLADEADETFLLSVLSTALEIPLEPRDIIGSYAGLRPLHAEGGGPTADLSRDHRILERPDGMLTIVGGKLTTYRKMARDVVDRVVARGVPDAGPCVTATQPLVGAAPRARLARLPAPAAAVARYGTEAVELEAAIARDPSLGEPLFEGTTHRRADLAWAVEHEGALTVSDLLDRRTRLGLVPADRRRAEAAAAETLAGAPASP
jgi:glycerol-3-phosphate dehydrogenase